MCGPQCEPATPFLPKARQNRLEKAVERVNDHDKSAYLSLVWVQEQGGGYGLQASVFEPSDPHHGRSARAHSQGIIEPRRIAQQPNECRFCCGTLRAAQAVKKDAKTVETTVVQDAEKAKTALKHDK
jgi:hypothetical protein